MWKMSFSKAPTAVVSWGMVYSLRQRYVPLHLTGIFFLSYITEDTQPMRDEMENEPFEEVRRQMVAISVIIHCQHVIDILVVCRHCSALFHVHAP